MSCGVREFDRLRAGCSLGLHSLTKDSAKPSVTKCWSECSTMEKTGRVAVFMLGGVLCAVILAAIVALPGWGIYKVVSLASQTAATISLSVYGSCVAALIAYDLLFPNRR